MTTFPTEFSALPTVNGSTKVLADDGTNNGTATVAQIVANAGPDTRVPTSGNTVGNIPQFTSTGGQLGASPISVSGSNVGIGPTAPAEKLHVSGAVKVVGGYGNGNAWDGSVTIGGAGSGSADLGSISWGDGTGYKLHLGPKPGNGAFTPKFTFTDTGSLSIGTAGLPSYNGTLQVYGPSSFDGSGGGVNSLLNGFSSSAAGAGVGASFVLGGKTGNAVDLYAFGALKAYKKTGGADGSYAGKLGLFTTDQYGTVAERITVDDAGNVGIGTTAPTDLLDVNSDAMRLRSSKTPASASAAGNAGEMCWDASYLYVCVATNTWRRVAHSSW